MTESINRDVFNREPRYFTAMGKEFKMEFIPSEHMTAVLVELLTIGVNLGSAGELKVSETGAAIEKEPFLKAVRDALQNILKNQVYELMSDVLVYQNDARGISANVLKKKVSLLEMTKFVGLVITDDEVLDAVEEFVSRAGELLQKIPGRVGRVKEALKGLEDPFLTPKSEPSSPITSESPTQ
jgi:sulfur transfer complex TusBCD TusB component (DsrH family)